ncbi:hypothetical protein GHO45_10540 [Pseudomonas sp. FSL R10-0765]|nr:hypothetical protein [Pseudomonas sp. FSL R10-0765]
MKLDKKQAIARRNQELGGAVLGVNNCHLATLNTNKNIWWFDIPLARLAIGQYEWVHLLLHTPSTDELLHLKVTTAFLREKREGMVCSGLMKPDTHLGENARQIEVSDDQTTPLLFR